MEQNSKIKTKEINILNLMINTLCLYLKGLNEEKIKFISDTIMKNFLQHKQKMIIKKMNNIFCIYKKQEVSLLQEKLLNWHTKILFQQPEAQINLANNSLDNYFHLNLNVGPIMNNSQGVPIIINNNSNNNISNSNINNSNMNINNLNEEKEVNNYIDKNNIKRNSNNNLKGNNNVMNSSYSNYYSMPKGKQRPHSSEAPRRSQNYIPRNKNLIYETLKNKIDSEIVNKFMIRQEKYKINNCKKKQKIIRDNEEEYKLIYTFEPKVNDSLRKLYKKDKLAASKRLYNDSIIRKNKLYEKQFNLDNNRSKNGKSLNPNKYNELYEQSKIKKEKQEELIKKIEKECGYTYAPNIGHKKDGNKTKLENSKSFTKIKKKNNKANNLKKLNKHNSCNQLVKLQKKETKKK